MTLSCNIKTKESQNNKKITTKKEFLSGKYAFVISNKQAYLYGLPYPQKKIIKKFNIGDRIKLTRVLDGDIPQYSIVAKGDNKGWIDDDQSIFYFHDKKLTNNIYMENEYVYVSYKKGFPLLKVHGQSPLIPQKSKVYIVSKNNDILTIYWKGLIGEINKEFTAKDLKKITYFKHENAQLAEAILKTNENKVSKNDLISKYDFFIKKIENNKNIYKVYYYTIGQVGNQHLIYDLWYLKGITYKKMETNDHPSMHKSLLNLNNDDYIDMIIEGGCCDSHTIEIYLGQEDNKMIKIFDGSGLGGITEAGLKKMYKGADISKVIFAPEFMSKGKCKKLRIKYKKKIYYLDCSTNKMVIQ